MVDFAQRVAKCEHTVCCRHYRCLGRSQRGCMSACPPVTVGQFLSRPRWCSLGFPYSASGPRWELLSPGSPWFVPVSKFLATPLIVVLVSCKKRRHGFQIGGRSAACLVGIGSIVLVDQTTDGSTRFVTTPATSPRRYGDQPFFVAMAQE